MKELKLIAIESIAIKQIERIKINWNDKIWHKLSKLILEESFFLSNFERINCNQTNWQNLNET